MAERRSHSFGFVLIAGGAVLLAGVLGNCQRTHFPGGLAKLRPCRLEGIKEELLCGKLTVFENRQTRAGRTIDLNVVILPAFDQKTKAEPFFHLEGGPGAAATEVASFYATAGRDYRKRHDVVLVDQRGSGESNRLALPPNHSPQALLSEMYPVEYVRKLRAACEQHADLTQYTTPVAMDDLDDVRAWLGYDRINLFGLSYGTRAALVYLRQHPAHVRTITLVGIAPTYLRMPMYHSEAADHAMNSLLDECERDSKCHEAFPEIRDDWRKVLEQLRREPARTTFQPADSKSAPVAVEIRGDIFAEKIRTALYARDAASHVPLLVHEAAQGNFEPFLRQFTSSGSDFIADGMYLSVTCAEDVPFIDQDEAAKMDADNPFGNYRVFQQTRACGLWPRGVIPANYREPVQSDVPALLFSGGFDPVTPPPRGEEVAGQLPNSRHLIIPEAAHGPFGLTNVDCFDKLILEFLEKAEAKDLNVRCVEQMKPPEFRIK